MTISEIKASTKPFLTAAGVAGVIGCNPETIRWQARNAPIRLGFPVVEDLLREEMSDNAP